MLGELHQDKQEVTMAVDSAGHLLVLTKLVVQEMAVAAAVQLTFALGVLLSVIAWLLLAAVAAVEPWDVRLSIPEEMVEQEVAWQEPMEWIRQMVVEEPEEQ
jgi:hypothetical protein